MHKKGSMELSVNSIVILVIAVVMMGLILGFLRAQFSKVDIEQPEPAAPVASSGDILTLSRETLSVSPGKSATLKASVYNRYSSDITANLTISCSDSALLTSSISNAVTIPTGDQREVKLLLKLAKNKPLDSYLCKINIRNETGDTAVDSSYQKDITIELR